MAISSRTRNKSSPRSAQLIVTWRISSSKHCLYNSRRTGHIPVSRACVCCNRESNVSWRLITSCRVAGVLETVCVQSWPSSSQQRGGRIVFKISSVSLCGSTNTPPPPLDPGRSLGEIYKTVIKIFGYLIDVRKRTFLSAGLSCLITKYGLLYFTSVFSISIFFSAIIFIHINCGTDSRCCFFNKSQNKARKTEDENYKVKQIPLLWKMNGEWLSR